MNQDDIDFDKLFDEDLPFKPLTKGLGFHHSISDKDELATSLKDRSKSLDKSLSERASYLKKQEALKTEPQMKGDLAPFYNIAREKELEPELSSFTAQKNDYQEASLGARFIAFIVDIQIIGAFLAITFLSIFIASDVPLELVREKLSPLFFTSSVLPISVLFYFFYFSFFDKTNFSTPGKNLMEIRVYSERRDSMKMTQAFSRAFIVLMSLFSLGLISIFNFQNKFTGTKVIRRR